MKQKIGIFGGTFDPVHIGHIITTRFVLEQRKLDRIVFIPCNISPLKTNINSTTSEHRLNMLKLAVENHPQFDFSDYEIQKGEVSFTFDTLCEMQKKYSEIELIIGYDNLVLFDKWKNPDGIFDITKVVVMKRHGTSAEKPTNKYFDKAIILDTPSIEISSTEIRERVKNNLPIDFLVPEKVKEYIYQNKLYK
jgi:nicotinate-nucleotide adenylyltransferase